MAAVVVTRCLGAEHRPSAASSLIRPWHVGQAPWEIRRQDLESEPVRSIIEQLRRTGKLVLGVSAGARGSLFPERTE